jgi:integrase
MQAFLTKQATKYSKSSLKSMQVVLCMTLKWAGQTGYLDTLKQPAGWLDSIRLPPETFHGREVTRTPLAPEQTLAFVARMKEPYSTLVLCLGSLGMRGEAAIGLQPVDLDDNLTLHVRRIIYNGQAEELEKEELYPLDEVVHSDLIRRLRELGHDQRWIFHTKEGTPLNHGNARRRHLHKAATALGIKVAAGMISVIPSTGGCGVVA